MKTTFYSEENIDFFNIKKIFEKGGIIGFPTETVYGIGSLISNDEAIEKIYKIKKRDRKKSFIIHLARIEDVNKVAEEIPNEFYTLAKYFMPGPLTVILKKKKSLNKKSFPLDTVAIRVPAHGITLKFLKYLKEPIVGSSANISNEKSAISAKEVLNIFNGKISSVVDGGICPIGIPSTIVSLINGIKIIREGFVKKEQIELVLEKK